MTRRRAKLVIVWLIGFVVVAYAAVVGLVWYKQDELIYPAPRGPGGAVAGYQAVAYDTADGLRLTGGYRPARPGMPTLLFFHGNASDWQGSAWVLEPLAREGYGVFAASYRGYRSNPGHPSEAGLYRDARAAVAWLAARGIGSGDLVIVGNSLGSGPAVEIAKTLHPRGLALISPYASLRQLAAAHFRWLPVELLMRDRYDNAAKLPEVAAPVLIMHGDRDTVIPLAQAEQLRARANHVTFVVVPGAGHELVARDEMPGVLREWLRGIEARPATPTTRSRPAPASPETRSPG